MDVDTASADVATGVEAATDAANGVVTPNQQPDASPESCEVTDSTTEGSDSGASSTIVNDSGSKAAVQCGHYMRGCKLKAACCNEFYSCRFCHDDAGKCDTEMDRYAVTEILCLNCDEKQLVNEKCQNCGETFAKYFCSICRMFDDNIKKFHCKDCGLCRAGEGSHYKHCDRCCVCYTNDSFVTHKCVEKAMDRNCPVCLEFLHTSRKQLFVPPCGHILHACCYQDLLKSAYTCPICSRAYMDMTAAFARLQDEIDHTPMPTDYQNHVVRISCNDCHAQCTSKFHLLGHKCNGCQSFNTTVTGGPFSPEQINNGCM